MSSQEPLIFQGQSLSKRYKQKADEKESEKSLREHKFKYTFV
jgi:hypothetical protein